MRALCIPPCMDCARCVQGESKQQQQQQEGVKLREGRRRMGETVVERWMEERVGERHF